MDYTFNVNGIDILIEQHTDEDRKKDTYKQRNRLLSYYTKLLETKGLETDIESYNALNFLVDNMTEDVAKKKADNFEKAQLQRLLSYATKFAEAKKKTAEEAFAPGEIDEMANALLEVIDATKDDCIENQEVVEINGNKFIYEKGTLDIKEYAKKLFDIGNENRGNTWTIYLNEEGELVIY